MASVPLSQSLSSDFQGRDARGLHKWLLDAGLNAVSSQCHYRLDATSLVALKVIKILNVDVNLYGGVPDGAEKHACLPEYLHGFEDSSKTRNLPHRSPRRTAPRLSTSAFT